MSDFNLNQIAKENSELAKTGRYDDMLKGIREPKTNTSGNWTDTVKGIETPNDLLFGTGFAEEKQKPSLSKQVNITEGYANVGGEWLRMFPTYKEGRDNAEYAAQNQSETDKIINGSVKAYKKFQNAVFGGTVGTVYGAYKAISEGSLNAFSDNDLTNWMADLDEKMNYQLPNYYTKQNKEEGLIGQLTNDTSNFLADKVLGGLSFTAGAIVSEGIWAYATGGSSLATTGARWGAKALGAERALAGIAKYKGIFKPLLLDAFKAGKISKAAAIRLGQAGEVANLVRFTGTSAGYESSVETIHFKREARENFYGNFEKLNNRPPSEEEIATFEDKLGTAANSVFLSNMVIVGASNLATMGSIFDLKSPFKIGAGKFLDKKLFNVGTKKLIDDAGKVSYEVLKPTTLNKAARNIFQYTKAGVTEGLFEEGLQGVTTKVANKWMEYGYDPRENAKQADLMGMAYDSMAEQYGTKEGWVENGVGALIGLLGGGVNANREIKQRNKELEFETDFANNYQSETLASNFLSQRMINSARAQGFAKEAEKHKQKGNLVEAQIANTGQMQSYFNGKHYMGENIMDTIPEIKVALDTVTNEQYKDSGIEESEIDDYKETILNSYKSAAKSFKTNRKFAEYTIGKSKIVGAKDLGETSLGDVNLNEMAIQSLTWTLTAGQDANQSMAEIRDVLAKEVGEENSKTLETITELSRQKSNRKGQITKIAKDINVLLIEQNNLVKKIAKLSNAPKETEGNKEQAKQLFSAKERLTEVNDKITGLETEVNDFVEDIKRQKQYQQGVEDVTLDQNILGVDITADDVFNLKSNVAKFENLISGLKEAKPERHEYLSGLVDEYGRAQQLFDTYQATSKMIIEGKMNLKSSNNWLSGIVNKNKSMDEMTKEWLSDILNKYATLKAESINGKNTTQEQNQTVEEDLTEDELIVNIANKEKAGQDLTDEEVEALKNEEVNNAVNKLMVGFVKPKKQEVKEIKSEKDKIDDIINNRFKNLFEIPNEFGELTNVKPTDEEIEKYRELLDKKQKTKEFQDLKKKLSNWKILNSITDEDYNSVADLLNLSEQIQQQEEVLNTKDEITQEDTPQISDDLNGSSSLYVPELLQNVTANAKVKKDENGNFRLSHILPQTIIDRLGGEVVFSKETKDISKIKPDTTFTVGGIKFTYLKGGVIVVSESDFTSSTTQQALNLYIVDTKTSSWTYKDIYEVKGDQWVKKESDFKEERLKNDKEAIYNLKAEDEVTFHLYNENGYNGRDVAKKDRLAQLQIIALDSKGKMVGTVKRMQGSVEGNFLAMREKAIKLYEENPKASIISLGMSSKVKNVYLGTPQLNIQDGKVQNYNFNSKSAKQVLATGYILDGEMTSSVEFSDGIDRTFVAKLSKGNQGKKIPFVVVKKGVYNIAYPVSMIKSLDSKAREFDFIISQKLSPQETILKINDAIQKNGIRVNKLTFDDINNQAKLDEVRKAFDTKQTFLSLEDFADKNYKKESLITDAKINIDIEDIDNAISDAKIRISFEQEDFTISLTKEQEAEIKSNEEARIKEQQKVSEELKNNGEKNNCN